MNPPAHRQLMIVTDAWSPQTNGVVTTLNSVMQHLPDLGITTTLIHPGLFRTWPLPSYPEIRIARNPGFLKTLIDKHQPDAIHIATEGPLGLTARNYCVATDQAFTTSLHTKFPEYVAVRFGLSPGIGYRFMRWFHKPSVCTLVTTESHKKELEQWGLADLTVWSRGVDTARFQPAIRPLQRVRPRLLYVGRIAVEKNVEEFLRLDLDVEKVIVGDGPARMRLQAAHPEVTWLGYRHGNALVQEYADADVFVFPSLTDTFGLVMLEAMACGTPVAAFPVTGPKDIIRNRENGYIDWDLKAAVSNALEVDRKACRAFALQHDWREIALRLATNLVDRQGHRLMDSRDPGLSITSSAA